MRVGKVIEATDKHQGQGFWLRLKSNLVSVAITACVVALMVIYAWYNRDTFAGLFHIRWDSFLWLAVLWVPYQAIPGWRIRAFMRHFQVRLSAVEWFGLSVITSTANWVLPFQGGAIPSAMYLKRRRDLPYFRYVSFLVGSYILFFLVTATMALAISILIYLQNGNVSLIAVLFFSAVLLGTLVILIFSPAIPPSQIKAIDYARRILEGWREMRSDWHLICTIAATFVLGIVTTALTLYVSYRALSVDVGFLPVMLLSIIASYAIFVKLTPGNLGIREALIALTSEMIGTGFQQGFATAVLFRGIDLLLTVVFGPIFSYILSRRVSLSNRDH